MYSQYTTAPEDGTASVYSYNQPYPTPYYYPQQFVTPTYQPLPADAPRTIYLGNVTADMQPADILQHVHCGLVDSFRMVPDKTCAFLTFVEPASAQIFYSEYMVKKLIVHNIELRVGWGKNTPLPPLLKTQIQSGASRNVYFGHLQPSDTEESLYASVCHFGEIESVRVIPDKSIGFVHFLAISSAIKCITQLPSDPAWKDKKVNFGKDHCADGTESYRAYALGLYGQYAAVNKATENCNRTLYIGNIHPEATCEEICNAIRGGNLLQIRYLQDKHIAFVTFFDAATALNVYNHMTTTNINAKGKRFRIGWGKPSSITSQVALAVNSGATRNIYIGGIGEDVTVEKLRADFAEYGETELVNIMPEKKCGFVNFTSVQNAMKALIGIKTHPDYAQLKINYGKDRCGNAWKKKEKKEEPAKKEEPPKQPVVLAELTEANLRKFTAQNPVAKKINI